ncbi:MAG: RelA/SpoT domain-containing protein [Actinomycetota bacterium]|nr:RelA/SpoT domain-containing protein [Actinomycetota bacterium]
MAVADLEVLRQRYLAERPAYAALADDVAVRLRAATRQRGLICEVEGRAKDVASFLKKALRKEYASPWDDIRDKAAARVVTIYESQVEEVEDLVRELFVVHHYEDKRHSLAPDTLSYLGVHFEVSLPPRVAGTTGAEGRLCEIQVHTRAQNLWATVSHELLYKPAQAPPGEVTRSIYRLMALLELFDGEVGRGRQQIQDHPGYEEARMLDTLERQFYALAGRHADIELSRRVVSALADALSSEEAAAYEATLSSFVDRNREKLTDIFAEYAEDDRNPLLSQPECLLVFERLSVDPFRLAHIWDECLPPPLLRSLSAVWGAPIDG